MNPRLDRLLRFIDHPKYSNYVQDMFSHIDEVMTRQTASHGQGFKVTGLPGLAVHCSRKGNRLFSSIVEDKLAQDKLDDEIEDMLMYSVYTYLYYKMLKDGLDGN